MPRLCLNMIVRNEADHILRCLASVAPYVSSWAILDTGSTDGTPEIIERFFAEWQIPGVLAHRPFDNFENSRNAALELARGMDDPWEFLLLCDADMELVARNPNWAPEIPGVYGMQQTAGTLSYQNVRVVSRDCGASYVGVTHEYFDAPITAAVIEAYFVDHADGSNREGKFERDIQMLSKALDKDPENPRLWFYLGQSYRDAGQTAAAAVAYKMRVELGGWDEEVWNAQTNVGAAELSRGNEAAGVLATLQAFQMRPTRAEPLADLAYYFRERSQHALALMFADAGRRVPYPHDDMLFVSKDVYEWRFDEETAICGFYVKGRERDGFKAADRLLLSPKTPDNVRHTARRNLYYYLKSLKNYAPSFSARRLDFPTEEGWVPMNPSITSHLNNLYAVVRTVNYKITPEGRYDIRAEDGTVNAENPINTRNFLVRLGADLRVETRKEIMPPSLPAPAYPLVRGFEDMRLFSSLGALRVTATVREFNPEGTCEQVMSTLREEGDHVSMTGPVRMVRYPGVHEKNWMPCVGTRCGSLSTLRFLYKAGEFVSYRDGKLQSDGPRLSHHNLKDLRGGSQLVAWGTHWLGLVHEAAMLDWSNRYYFHRFIEVDESGAVVKISKPFVFNDRQIEFAAGMAWVPGNFLVISYGVRDSEAWFATVEADEVERMLHAED